MRGNHTWSARLWHMQRELLRCIKTPRAHRRIHSCLCRLERASCMVGPGQRRRVRRRHLSARQLGGAEQQSSGALEYPRPDVHGKTLYFMMLQKRARVAIRPDPSSRQWPASQAKRRVCTRGQVVRAREVLHSPSRTAYITKPCHLTNQSDAGYPRRSLTGDTPHSR